MMRRGLCGWIAACLMGLSAPAWGAVTFERADMGDGRVLIVRGTFEFSDDPATLAAEVSAFQPMLVSFDSGGGNVVAAMRFGRAIRQMNLSTLQLRSSDCASACTLVFMGGVHRFAEPGAIGVHQASFSGDAGIEGHSAVAAVQALTAEIMSYMIEMGVDPQLLQLSLSTESSDMRYLTAGEMRRFRVTTEGEREIAAATPGPAPAPVQGAGDPDDGGRGGGPGDVLDFLHRYHAAWSGSNGEAMAFTRTAYADRVSYFGKTATRAAILKEKEAFARRWPVRAYALRPGSERVRCAATCRVEAVVDWHARSDARGKTASGAATIAIEWDPATRRILSEDSKVLKADRRPTRRAD
ncbi:hypothetical protein [Aureimonas sp. SK2]|uniref:COG3904 family protein n=1 Tax=Aureimonas sp. SK2 TaxID=3015992 RepID=UPI00244516DC|nr:hypothetical protein [Aureimonas sp. SK2]